jgi:hypothetical protein
MSGYELLIHYAVHNAIREKGTEWSNTFDLQALTPVVLVKHVFL